MKKLQDIQYPAIYSQLARDFLKKNITLPGIELSLDFVFNKMKIPLNTLEDPHAKLNGKQIEMLLSFARLLANKKTPLSLQLIDLFKQDTLGIFGLAILNSSSAAQSLEVFLRFYHLYSPGFEFTTKQEGEYLSIYLQLDVQFDKAVEKTMVEIAFATFSYFIRQTQVKTQCRHFFRHSPDHAIDSYTRGFTGEVKFEQSDNKIQIHQKYLSDKIDTANLAMQKIYLEQLEQELKSQETINNIKQQALKLLTHHAAQQHFLSRQQLADALACSERTLTRRLKNHDSSYQQLIDQVRADIACTLLKGSGKSNQQIASLVGINNSSVFCRSFKKWTGLTPNQYRHTHC